jgi:hypothetical protein
MAATVKVTYLDWKHAALRWQKEACVALGIPVSSKTKVLAKIRKLQMK